jgi:hypothetical protein
MRLRLLFAPFCAVIAIWPRSATAEASRDGFAICEYADSAIGKCEPLTDWALSTFGLTSQQVHVVEVLRTFAVKPDQTLGEELAQSKLLAAPKQFVASDRFSDYWFPDGADATQQCIECGVHQYRDSSAVER